ncbi:MAG: hypothetical protein HQ553_16385 [Chloroflexi bacterium]|nr:hypothetical protein [Chloroflexota bacterium]
MPNSFGIYGADDTTKLKFRVLCIAKGLTARELFKNIVDEAWENNDTVPDEQQTKLVKRLIKRSINRLG